MVAPIGVVFPMLFKHAALLIEQEDKESKFLSTLKVEMLKRVTHSAGHRILYVAYSILSLWVAGAIFLCLIYGYERVLF
jgi:hypothetical protein